MIYLVNVSYGTQPKNKLQETIKAELMNYHRMVISEEVVEIFLNEITEVVNKCNADYPRCTQVKPYWERPETRYSREETDYHMYLQFCTINLMKQLQSYDLATPHFINGLALTSNY